MTRTTPEPKVESDKRRIISYDPTPENLEFLESEKSIGIPYAFTIDKALDGARKRKAKR